MNRIERIFSSLVIRNSIALALYLLIGLLWHYYAERLVLSGKDIPGVGTPMVASFSLIATVFSTWANWHSFKSIQNTAARLVLRTTLIIIMVLIMFFVFFLATAHIEWR